MNNTTEMISKDSFLRLGMYLREEENKKNEENEENEEE